MNYDAVLKSILEKLATRFLCRLVGSEPVALLNVEFNSVDRRVPDLLMALADGRILHVELQASNDRGMALRMLRYRVLLMERHPESALEQLVLYVGSPPLAMADGIHLPQLEYRYLLHDMREFDGRELLCSPDPAERVLALLCGSPEPAAAVREVLKSWSGLPRKELASLLEKLIIISGLRHVEGAVERELKSMPLTDEVLLENEFIRKWIAQGVEQGMQQGMEQGRQQGMQQGRQEGSVDSLRRALGRLIEQKFGHIPAWAEERVMSADQGSLEGWLLRVLDAETVDDVLRP